MTTPTLATARQAYLDNASYEADNDATKAAAFITACRQLLVLLPAEGRGPQGASAAFSIELIAKEMAQAQQWLAAAAAESGAGGVIFYDFGEFDRG